MKSIKLAIKSVFGFGHESNFPDVIRMHDKKMRLLDIVVFPYIDLNDPMRATLFKKATNEMVESYTGNFARVDICPIDQIIKIAGMTLYGNAADAYEWLRKLHCVRFRDMHADIAKQVPHRINMVFANGDYRYPWENFE
ncbi:MULTISPECIES: hypothetical protein [unclassified Cedecea]|uniref:hypothetical protein n=1 Tax=unclassified Cedecea TaxID=2649846 RepID=UPI003018FFA3